MRVSREISLGSSLHRASTDALILLVSVFGVSAIREFLKYGMYGKSSWYIAYCPLYGRCPLSTKRGSTVYI